MPTTNTVIIGAGQAGLAASRCPADRGHDHVVLERGRIGHRWRTETWDSLHLLTPNWMNELPGRRYRGADPDGFTSATAFADHLADYVRSFAAPVVEQTGAKLLENRGGRFQVVTDQAVWDGAQRHRRDRLVRPAGHPRLGRRHGPRRPSAHRQRVP
jgi:putative flavoprotein involved in K+ transport